MKISKDFEKYKITIPPEKLHDMLYYSTLYIGEGGTTAAEAALLGTPSIFVSTNVQYLGVFQSLQNKYDLIYACSNQEEGLKKAIEFLECNNLKEEWGIKKNRVFKENMDITNFMTDFIENYPESFYDLKKSRM
jgi:predicted glycosyltransferase